MDQGEWRGANVEDRAGDTGKGERGDEGQDGRGDSKWA